MKKHIVTCVKCGRQFDANEGGSYYPESRRYVCKHCVDKQAGEAIEPRPLFLHDYTSERLPRAPAASSAR